MVLGWMLIGSVGWSRGILNLPTTSYANINDAFDKIDNFLRGTAAETTYNVKSPPYNAKCDGIIDDSAAIQRAIDAANAAGGGVVFIPTGTCIINTAALLIKSNVTISGTGPSSILKTTIRGYIIADEEDLNDINIGVNNLTLDGGYPAGTDTLHGNAIYLEDAQYITLDSLVFKNNYGHATYFGESDGTKLVQDMVITNIRSETGNRGVIGLQYAKNVIVDGVISIDDLGGVIYIATPTSGTMNNISFSDVYAYVSGGGTTQVQAKVLITDISQPGSIYDVSLSNINIVYDPPATANVGGALIEGNRTMVNNFRVVGGGRYGINVADCDDCSFSNLILNNNGTNVTSGVQRSGIYLSGGNSNCVFNGVTASDTQGSPTQQYGIYEQGAAPTSNRFINLNLRNNVVAPIVLSIAAGLDTINTAYPIAFANLSANAGNGSTMFCSDCTIANPCAGAGTGAIAKRLNGAWVCN
jgi:hypothetical protein